MPENRPHGRKTNVTGQSTGAYRRGEGLNTGPVGSSGSNPHNTGSSGNTGRPGMSRAARAGGGGGMLIIIILVLFFLLRGGGGLFGSGSNLSDGNETVSGTTTQSSSGTTAQSPADSTSQSNAAGTESTSPFSGLTDGGQIAGYSNAASSP